MKKFDPSLFRGKKSVAVKIKYLQGIREIFDWSESKNRYLRRKAGLKYSAIITAFGKQKEKYFDSLEEAKKWRKSGGHDQESKQENSLLFEDLLAKYLSHIKSKVRPNTLKNITNKTLHLKALMKMRVTQITPKTIDSWLERVKKPDYVRLCKSTKITFEREVSLLRSVFKYYSKYLDHTFFNPILERHNEDCIIDVTRYHEAKQKNKSRYMSPKEIKDFLIFLWDWGQEDHSKMLYFALALFQLRTGVRIGEACALSFSDIIHEKDLTKAIIAKTVSWKRGKDTQTSIQNFTKTNEYREVYLSRDLQKILGSLYSKQENQEALIFSRDGIAPISYRSIQYGYDKAFESLGQKWRSSHILRHSFSTEFLRITQNKEALSRLLGHSSMRQTEHYAKITQSTALEGFETYSLHLEENLGISEMRTKI
jgi:integrase